MGQNPLEPEPDDPLFLGERRDAPGEAVNLPVTALLRHVMALGSSGSGKTVFCKVLVEEAALRGVPVIAIDPQGDLASLALPLARAAETDPGAATGLSDTDPDQEAEPAAELHESTVVDDWAGVGPVPGSSLELAPAGPPPPPPPTLHDRVDVVVFTPASRRGVPLSADPVEAQAADLGHAARVRAFTRTAGRIVSLLGYDLDGDEGAGLLAVFDRCLNEMADEGQPATSLRSVTERLERMGPKIERYGRYLDERKIRAACRRAARLDVGARRLLFHDGVPIDIDVLLGRRPAAAHAAGKTRVSIIYLNTLEAQEDKDFVVATIADRLVSWMLQNPSPELQALFYIDEVAPFLPPVRKPACKEDLQVLFKQARKFGVGCVVATQNPGDVDYKAMGQFGTWAIGRLATRQDLKKVEPAVRSLMPAATPLLDEVPSLRPGELVLLSPDHFDEPCQLATRWLHTEHRTLDEEKIGELAEPWHERFARLGVPSDTRPTGVPLEPDETVAADLAPVGEPEARSQVPPPPEQRRTPGLPMDPDLDRTLQWARSSAPVPDRARDRDGDRDGDRDEDANREPVPDPKRDRAANLGPVPDPKRDGSANRGPVPDRKRERHPAPARKPARVRRRDRPPDRDLERDLAPDRNREEREAGHREPERDPDPSWAWPRDPELAWIRTRDTEPAWAPSPSPPRPSLPPGDRTAAGDRESGRTRGRGTRSRERASEGARDRGRTGARARARATRVEPRDLSEPRPAPLDPPVLPPGRVPDDSDDKLRRLILILGSKLSMTVPEFADRAGIAERTARARLKAMVDAGHAGRYREERTVRYWARSTGARPDLGMKASVLSVQPRIDHGTAENIGRGLVKSKVLGLLGQDESFAQARLVYRLVYRVGFQEKVKRPLLGRLIGPSHEERLGNVYLHPRTLDVLLFSLDAGIHFATRLPDHASEVNDLDGVVSFLDTRPGDISFDEEEWNARLPPQLARKRLRETFGARPGTVTPVFVPLWKLLLRRGAGDSYRVETVDALAGMPIDWPEPR